MAKLRFTVTLEPEQKAELEEVVELLRGIPGGNPNVSSIVRELITEGIPVLRERLTRAINSHPLRER